MTNQIKRVFRRLNVFGTGTAAMLALTLVAGCYAPPQERGAVRVIHALQVPFAAAEALDANGTTLSTETFHCAPNQACSLFLPQNVLAQTAALRFRDAQGRLVGAYPKGNLANVGYTVTADADMMGVELFNRLVAQGTYTPATLIHLADEHLYREYPAGDRPSFFADLQAHYQRSLADPAYNEQKYLDDVLKAIAERNGGQTSAVTTGPAAQGVVLKSNTTPVKCDSTLKGITILATDIGKSVARAFPVAAGFIDGIGGILSTACNSTTAELSKIMSTLDEVQKTVTDIDIKITALGVRLDQFAADVAFRDFEKNYAAFTDDLSKLTTFINTYRSLLSPTPSSSGINGYQEPVYADLSSYIQGLGGLTLATYKDNGALKTLLGGLSGAISDHKRLLDVSSANAMNTDLYTLCRTSSTIIDDIIRQRNLCITRALRLITEASAATVKLRFVVGDVFNALSNANDSKNEDTRKFLKDNLLNSFSPGESWKETHVLAVKNMYLELDAFIKVMFRSVFDNPVAGTTLASVALGETPADGLAPALLNNIMLAGCSKSFEGKSFAAIEGWVVQGAQPSPYITTQCQGRNNELVYSQFHYTTDVGNENTVLNMLGVLINPADAVKAWENMNWNRNYPDFAWPENGDHLGGDNSNSPWVCITKSDDFRCDWWMVVPGVTGTGKGDFTQVRSHTGPACGFQCLTDPNFWKKTQRVQVSDTTLYAPPVNDRILHPVNAPRGRDAGYQSGAKSQYLWGSVWSNGPWFKVQEGFLSYTRVATENQADWDAKPDRRNTRTVVIRVGQGQRGNGSWVNDTLFFARCVTADCEWSHYATGVGFTKLKFTNGGPTIQWNYFDNEWGAWHMFVDKKSSDGRAFPERR
jgi:hypothetical protein